VARGLLKRVSGTANSGSGLGTLSGRWLEFVLVYLDEQKLSHNSGKLQANVPFSGRSTHDSYPVPRT